MADIWTEQDSDDEEIWIDMTGDDLALTESSTWKVEAYVSTTTDKE
ncbi:hypothetical protein OG601_24170 [Streptomyces sp. NBC_01239]|nr:hypothetical protein [Streptomyces sp. NBC_01239]MCX4813699.1 hypothetical protein [Streptomyces sp. NBC_01239]